ncbi:MAG: hypothetical protein ACK47B_01945 [Armatimonadota bacterium]
MDPTMDRTGKRTVPRSPRSPRWLVLTVSAAALAALSGDLSRAGVSASRTYTTTADFDRGTLFNVNHDAPNGNQLQLNARATTFPVMWIANAGEDTVSKIDTNTGKELARYRTWFGPEGQPGHLSHLGNAYAGAAPSRTAVDSNGDMYVANRHFDGRPAEVLKILSEGGIDRNGNGTIDTSEDTNGNGVIDPGEILPMGDTNGNGAIDLSEIRDERIEWVSPPVGPPNGLGRSLAIDNAGDLWVGLYTTQVYFKLSSADGGILAGPIDVTPNTPYGAIVDADGNLWGASLGSTLLKLNTSTQNVTVYNHSDQGADYGIAIGNGKVYQASLSGHSFIEFDPVTESFSTPAATQFSSLGIAVDSKGDIFTGPASGGITKFRPDGSVIWSSVAQPGTGEVRGVIIDSNDDVWLIHRTSNNISKYRGTDGGALGVFPVGDQPYTYTDATGVTGFGTRRTGRWSVVQDSGSPGTQWGRVRWNQEPQGVVPPGASITAVARAADTEAGLSAQGFVDVQNGVPFAAAGRFLELRITLSAPPGDAPGPVLSDVTIGPARGGGGELDLDAKVKVRQLWPPDHRMRRVHLEVTGTKGAAVDVQVFSNEDDDDPSPTDLFDLWAVIGSNYSPDADQIRPVRLRLRAERDCWRSGRIYLIVVRAESKSGATGLAATSVTVPRDRLRFWTTRSNAESQAAVRYALSHDGQPPPGYSRIGE